MKRFLALLSLLTFISVAHAQTFDYTPLPLGSTAKAVRDDLQLEYTGINTNKVDFTDIDTSAEILAIVTNETGTGALVFSTSPTLVTPVLGAATATTINGATITSGTLNGTVTGTNTGDDDVPDAADFGALALTGDVTSSGLATTIGANTVALTTDTTGNYALGDAEGGAATTGDSATAFFSAGTIDDARIDGSAEADEVNPTLGTQTQGNFQTGNTAGAGIAITQTPAEGFSSTVALSYADAGADPALGTDACQFTSNATTPGVIVCEGDTADTFESRVVITEPTADRAFTIPNADSVATQPLTCGGTDKVSAISALGVLTCTADAGAGGGISNIVEDLTPQLGGALDTNGQNIEFGTAATDTSVVRSSAGNLTIEGNIVYRAGGTDVPITDGGTGQGTATAAFDALAPTTTQGDVIYHNGTDNVRLAPGTDGQVLTSNGAGANPAWETAAGGGKLPHTFVKTSGTTHTTNAATTYAEVIVIGAGHNGGNGIGGSAGDGAGAGGGGGGCARKFYVLAGSTAYTIAVGTTAGASSTFTDTITLITGSGGSVGGNGAATAGGTPGAGGTGTNGDINLSGGAGAPGGMGDTTAGSTSGGMGGPSGCGMGAGGFGGKGNTAAGENGGAGALYGGGGGGGNTGAGGGGTGGAFAAGVVIIIEYF